MLVPHTESNLSLNLIVLGSEIIYMLPKNGKYVFIDTIIDKFLEKDVNRTPEYFMDSATFLYAIGIINFNGHKIGLNYDLS